MKSIPEIMESLAKKRPIFHSEADFQHALAWEIHLLDSSARIRLEQRKIINGKPAYIDLMVSCESKTIAIELKYKTVLFSAIVDTEQFELKEHSARDVGTCMFWEDVARLEGLQAQQKTKELLTYAIFLTNEKGYWKDSKRKETNAELFRLTEAKEVGGILKWKAGTADGTKKGHENPITLANKYKLEWCNYGSLVASGEDTTELRYLLLEIPPSA